MSNIDLILSGLIALTPEPYRPAIDSERMRTYEEFAQDIETAATSPLSDLPFTGPAAIAATEAALEAIVLNESSIRQEVRDCRKKGDKGNSVSAFQLYRGKSRQGKSEKEICSDPVLAARLAIGILNWYTWVPKVENMFAGYAQGTKTEPNYASAQQTKSFEKLLKLGRVKVYKKQGESKFHAEFLPEDIVDLTNEPVVFSSKSHP